MLDGVLLRIKTQKDNMVMNVSSFGKQIAAIVLAITYCSSLEANDNIRGAAIIELRGVLTPVSISSVWNGQVTVRGKSIVPMKFQKGQVKKIWLVSKEAIPGIHDPLPTKYIFSQREKEFIPRPLPAPIKIGRWSIDQESWTKTKVGVMEKSLDPTTGRLLEARVENLSYWTVYSKSATLQSKVINKAENEVTARLTLEINLGEGFVNAAVHLFPKEEKEVIITFPTGGKEITSGLLVDYEMLNQSDNEAVNIGFGEVKIKTVSKDHSHEF